MGVCVGFVVPQLLISADESADPSEVHNETFWYMIYNAIAFTGVFVLTIFLVSDGPGKKGRGKNMAKHERLMDQELAASGVSGQDQDLAQNVGAQIKILFKRPVFNLFLIIYSIGWGAIPVVGGTFESLTHPYGYPATYGAITCVTVILVG